MLFDLLLGAAIAQAQDFERIVDGPSRETWYVCRGVAEIGEEKPSENQRQDAAGQAAAAVATLKRFQAGGVGFAF